MKKTIAILLLTAPLLAAGAFAGEKAAGAALEKPKAEAKQKKPGPTKAELRKVTEAEIGKEALCPVTGEKLTVKADTGSAAYKGKTYYFCCPGCDKSFLANPEKFVGKKPADAKKAYVCPMNDYQGDKPGKCPKCGMNLVEKK